MTDILTPTGTLPGTTREFTLWRFDDKAKAARWLADEIATGLAEAVRLNGQAILSGCGGSTPKPVYDNLAQAKLDWAKVVITQVDERFVPVDDAQSNTRMMTAALKPAIDKGLEFVTLTQVETDLEACVVEAEAALRALNIGDPPVFDITLLGMGEDAHYASIFPEHPINQTVYDTDALIMGVAPATDGSEPKLTRLTQTVAQINRSRRLILYITGAVKLEVLTRALVADDYRSAPIGAYLNQCPAAIDIVWAA